MGVMNICCQDDICEASVDDKMQDLEEYLKQIDCDMKVSDFNNVIQLYKVMPDGAYETRYKISESQLNYLVHLFLNDPADAVRYFENKYL